MVRLAPRQNGGMNGRLQRGGFVFDAVIAAQKTELIGINGLHGAFPRANLLAENAGNVGDGMKMQMTPDVFVAQAGAQQQCRGVNGAARGDYRLAAHADAWVATSRCFGGEGAGLVDAKASCARLLVETRAERVRVEAGCAVGVE